MAKQVMLITGSSGRIGKACVHRFADDYHVVGFDRHETQHAKEMDHITMDVSSEQSVKSAMEQVKTRYGDKLGPVIHLAAYYSFGDSKPELYDQITVEGTKRLLTHLQHFQTEQFLFSSTLLVHAPCQLGQTINENSPIEAKWDYPKSKVKTEKVIHDLHGKIPAVIMRIAGCYDDECHSIPIAHNAQRIFEHELEAHLYPGDIRKGNPFLHIQDLVDALELAISKQKSLPPELTLIIGEDKTPSYQELQNRISEILTHKDFRIFHIPKWIAKEGACIQQKLPCVTDHFIQPWMIDVADDHYALDISKAKKILGWQPKHYVINQLPIMLALLKTDPLAWYHTNELDPPKWLVKTVEEVRVTGAGQKKH